MKCKNYLEVGNIIHHISPVSGYTVFSHFSSLLVNEDLYEAVTSF